MKLNVLYRISEAGNSKQKLDHATKFYCLKNFCSEFVNSNIIIIADNCKPETIENLKVFEKKIIETSLGNAKSWRYCVEYSISNFNNNEAVYFVEDDYIHLPDSEKILLEGLVISDYVTLYDHPDKYKNTNNGGVNPLIKYGGEKTIVMLTEHSHWKITNSTTMTFAVKMDTLIVDKDIWWRWTEGNIPSDFFAFIHLSSDIGVIRKILLVGRLNKFWILRHTLTILRYLNGRNRKLITCLPGRSTHSETLFLSPLVDWSEFTQL